MRARLSRAAYHRARDFVRSQGRDLDAYLLSHAFDGVGAEPALATLARYQNPDGGFAHGLEPDLPTPASTAIVTSVGLQILRRLGAQADHPMARGAVAWLAGAFDREAGVWPIINADVSLTPHAFWWDWDPDLAARWNGFRFNPSAELLGDLYAYRSVADPAVVDRAQRTLLDSIASAQRLDGAYDVKALMRLIETEQTPAEVRGPAEALMAATRASFDPDDAHASPLDLVPRPKPGDDAEPSPAVEAALQALLAGQDADGGWRPFWDWSAVDAGAWGKAEQAWRSILTRMALETLAAYDRIEGLDTGA